MKKYLLIGAGSSIGQKITEGLLAASHLVYATSRNVPLQSGNISWLKADPLKDDLDRQFLPEGLDGMVYLPGTINLKPFRSLKQEDFQNDLEVNFLGAVRTLQWALPHFNEGSSIVLFSTVAVARGMAFHASISAAKGAVEGLGKALAAELAPKIRVNIVAPSLTQTPLASRLLNTEAKIEASADRHPLKRVGAPDDIASTALFLLSDESKWMTGQILHVDGGLSVI